MTRPVCSDCSIEKNRAEWAKYPEMMEMCKLCHSFQDLINDMIDKKQEQIDKSIKKILGKDGLR